jgi:hypothetical protein
MKIQSLVLTVMAALLIFSGDALAERPSGAGSGGVGGGSGGGSGDSVDEITDYGDLIILYRDDNGVPIPSPAIKVTHPETGLLVDGGLCWQPIAFNVSEDEGTTCLPSCLDDYAEVPNVVDVDQYTCAIVDGCSGCTQEVDFGRMNSARAPQSVFDSQLEDVVIKLATADCITLDPAGRLVASAVYNGATLTSTIDSPLQNLAIYRQLILTGFLGDAASPIKLPGGILDTAARGLGVASDKGGEVNVDMVAYTNSLMGLDDVPTILGKLCETYREEVQGVIQPVEKCYLDYTVIVPKEAGAYDYDRAANFGALPSPAYIPADAPLAGWFEYLAEIDPQQVPPLPPLFQILQGPILPPVFGVDPGFTDGNIGGFAQASDDTRAVINFMHDWPMPDADVFGTPVVCDADPDLIAYDVLISDVSGLQVPAQMVDGSEGREFFLTVTNASSSTDPATGTVKVTATPENGGTIGDSPWYFDFTALAPGASEQSTMFFTIALGERTTINWEATAVAGCAVVEPSGPCVPYDVNLDNNTVTATTSVKVTGGGGGGGKP